MNKDTIKDLAMNHRLWAVPFAPQCTSSADFNESLIAFAEDVIAVAAMHDSGREPIRDTVALMIEQKADKCELAMMVDGERMNVMIEIIGRGKTFTKGSAAELGNGT